MLQITIIIPQGILLKFVSRLSRIFSPCLAPISPHSLVSFHIHPVVVPTHRMQDFAAFAAHICLAHRGRNSFVLLLFGWFVFSSSSHLPTPAPSNFCACILYRRTDPVLPVSISCTSWPLFIRTHATISKSK